MSYKDWFKFGKRTPEMGNVSLTPALLAAAGSQMTLQKSGDFHAVSALQTSVTYQAVKSIVDTFSSLEVTLFTSAPELKKLKEDPRNRIFADKANDFQVPSAFWGMFIPSLLLKGNGFAKIERNGAGEPRYLVPLNADFITVTRENGAKKYLYKPQGRDGVVYADSEIIHVFGISFDGLTGISPLSAGASTFTLAAAQEDFAYRFFTGSNQRYFISIPGAAPKPEDREKIKSQVSSENTGLETTNGIGLLYNGATLINCSSDPDKAQLLATREAQDRRILSLLGVPAHWLGYTGQTFKNSEEQTQDYLSKAIVPWTRRIEQEINAKLLTEKEQETCYFRFDFAELLKADKGSRNSAYNTALQGGWLCVDDVRDAEDLPPIPDGSGKSYLQPANMVKAGAEGPEPTPIKGGENAKEQGKEGGLTNGNS